MTGTKVRSSGHGSSVRRLLCLSSQRDVVCVENRQNIQHSSGDQKRRSVIRADKKGVAAAIAEEGGRRHRQSGRKLRKVAQRVQIGARSGGKKLTLHRQAENEHSHDGQEEHQAPPPAALQEVSKTRNQPRREAQAKQAAGRRLRAGRLAGFLWSFLCLFLGFPGHTLGSKKVLQT